MPSTAPCLIVVDRVEGDLAVLDVGGQAVELPVAALPPGAGEGSVLAFVIQDDAALRAQAQARLDRLTAASKLPDDVEL
ncbi:DUF3006 domain-containing protein [Myxococcota bacterium]|nr:DUF3006 domain-containing protein [Myxococcota bacterium]